MLSLLLSWLNNNFILALITVAVLLGAIFAIVLVMAGSTFDQAEEQEMDRSHDQ